MNLTRNQLALLTSLEGCYPIPAMPVDLGWTIDNGDGQATSASWVCSVMKSLLRRKLAKLYRNKHGGISEPKHYLLTYAGHRKMRPFVERQQQAELFAQIQGAGI